ncbi:TPA: CHAP domain-containing protein [Candidatus Galligastranaerophilus gallistercoris]|nr:CHAP domain-containing protein [Candidatus Galligastranaerophilus gallistercoris]
MPSEFKIGNFIIQTQNAYDVLKAAGVTSDSKLKKIDVNSDNKISEDELVDLDFDDDSADETEQTSSSGTVLDDSVMEQIKRYDEATYQLEAQLNQLYSLMATSEDYDEMQGYQSSIDSLQSQIDNNRQQVYNLLVQAEGGGSSGGVSGAGSIGGGSSEFGNAVASIAQSYVGKLSEADGSYLQVTGGRAEHWCADFVTYVVSKACEQTGKSLNGFGSPAVANLRAWGEANGCYGSIDGMSSSQKAQWIVNNVKPGDVMIMQNNSSHTGIVTKVYSDGSFDTVEGNTSDQCLNRHYSADEARLSGFVLIT